MHQNIHHWQKFDCKKFSNAKLGGGGRPLVIMHPPATLHFKNVESPLLAESDLFIFELGFGV